MKIAFANEQEREMVLCTLRRLAETVHERSHTTGELRNLMIAQFILETAPLFEVSK